MGSPYLQSHLKIGNESKLFKKLHGPIGFNIGFAIGLIILNISLFYLLSSKKWDELAKQMTAYHDQVHEMSIRKHLYHQQISRSLYSPSAMQTKKDEDENESRRSRRSHNDMQFMDSSCHDFNSEQEKIMKRYVQEKDDEFDQLLCEEEPI